MTQVSNGKAFEYSLALAFNLVTDAVLEESEAFRIAGESYEGLSHNHQQLMDKASK